MSKPRVLISGASVAGPALAYWLVRAGCQVTVVERAPSLRWAGQGIDIRDAARDVVKRMDIFQRIRDKSSHEEGIEIFNSSNRCIARFGVDESGKGESFTSDVEILRGELSRILFDVTKDDASYIFGEMVESLEETEKEVRVNYANGAPAASFDLVVAADGLGSKIRGMIFGKDSSHIRSLDSYVAYFSVSKTSEDSAWAKFRWFTKGRTVMIRPDNVGRMRAFLGVTAYDSLDERMARLAKVSMEGVSAQKALVQELFQDGDWEVPRLIEGLQESDDFYLQHIAQVRLDRWSSGRVTMLGDAGYCPSPFTGMGTSLAFIGAYVLAGEISQQLDNIPAALESYERVLQPYVQSIQKLPPGIPWLVNPQSATGVKALETFAWGIKLLSELGIGTLLSKLRGCLPAGKTFELPDYEAFRSRIES